MNLLATLNHALSEAPYWAVFIGAFVYFSMLYFIGGYLINRICSYLATKGFLNRIVNQTIAVKQIQREIWYSLSSIIVFGITAVLVVYLVRNGFVQIAEESWSNLLLGLFVLTLWNEIHFYAVHRLLHLPWLMRHVHYIHHLSKVPTVYSIYSFHWLEALALGLVPVIVLLMMPLSLSSLVIYPVLSIVVNWIGHANYRIGQAESQHWTNLASNHTIHHQLGRKNYAFGIHLLDIIYAKLERLIDPKKKKQ